MNNHRENFDNQMERAIASSVRDAQKERNEIITKGLYQLIKEDPTGARVPSRADLIQTFPNLDKREDYTGWSIQDVDLLFNKFADNGFADNIRKAEQLFKGIQPTQEELIFVMNKMAKLGVLTVDRTHCSTGRFKSPDATTFGFNNEFTIQNLDVTGADVENAPASFKRQRKNPK